MNLKRKASFAVAMSPGAIEQTAAVDDIPKHLNSRTRKRFKDDRPCDEIIYGMFLVIEAGHCCVALLPYYSSAAHGAKAAEHIDIDQYLQRIPFAGSTPQHSSRRQRRPVSPKILLTTALARQPSRLIHDSNRCSSSSNLSSRLSSCGLSR